MMNSNLRKNLEAAAHFIRARSPIAIGLVLLLVVALCLAITLGLIPGDRPAVLASRGKICEDIAVFGSEFVQRNDLTGLNDALRTVADRNPDLLSAVLRRGDGKNLMQIGDPIQNGSKTDNAVDAEFDAPVFVDDKRWGQIEVRFKSPENAGMALFSPPVMLIAFGAFASMAAVLIFRVKTIPNPDFSKMVPTRVRSALDILTEGVLVVDNGGRIVLANNAFSKLVGRESDEMLGASASQFNWILEPGESGGSGEFPWTRALRERKPLHDIHIRLTDANHKPHVLSVNCSPLLGEDGEYRGVVNSFGDITLPAKQPFKRRKSDRTASTKPAGTVLRLTEDGSFPENKGGGHRKPIETNRPARATTGGASAAAKRSRSGKTAATLPAVKPALAAVKSSPPNSDAESYEVLFGFVDRLQAQLSAMQEAWKKQDLSELESLAHSVKTSGRTAGAATPARTRKPEKVSKKKPDNAGGSVHKSRTPAQGSQLASHAPHPPLLKLTEVREAFAACPGQFPPILSLSQAAKIARLKPATLTRLVREGKFKNCVTPGKPPLFWRDRFIMDLFNAEQAA